MEKKKEKIKNKKGKIKKETREWVEVGIEYGGSTCRVKWATN